MISLHAEAQLTSGGCGMGYLPENEWRLRLLIGIKRAVDSGNLIWAEGLRAKYLKTFAGQSHTQASTGLLAEVARLRARQARATYGGFQEDGFGGGFHLWTLTRAIPTVDGKGIHPIGSTVAESTLDAAINGGAK